MIVGIGGIARKVLNIFLRDALYTKYLSDAFNLSQAEYLFEIPLDSIVAKGIVKNSEAVQPPRWPGVKYLKPEQSHIYQSAAHKIAEQRLIARVHLDALWWSFERDSAMV